MQLVLPTYWNALTQEQLEYCYRLQSSELYQSEVVATLLFLKIAGLRDRRNAQYKGQYIEFADGSQYQRLEYTRIAPQIAMHLCHFDFLQEVPKVPIRLDYILVNNQLIKAPAADFSDVPFGTYLQVDNLYTGFLNTKNPMLLDAMIRLLYRADEQPEEHQRLKSLADDEQWLKTARYNMLMWYAGFKQWLIHTFDSLFTEATPSDNSDIDMQRVLREAMDAQILALTGGDITKEEQVLESDTIRALTNLNAIARRNKAQ